MTTDEQGAARMADRGDVWKACDEWRDDGRPEMADNWRQALHDRDRFQRERDYWREASAWQPIETAPKDGRDILIGWNHRGRWMVVAAHFTPFRSQDDNRPDGRGVWKVVKGSGESVWRTEDAFWMPLPPPPLTGEALA